MSLRIACDLDGTVADMDAALQHHAEVLFGGGLQLRGGGAILERAMNPEGVDTGEVVLKRGKGLSVRQMRELWTYVSRIENFWQSLNEVEVGSAARFAELATKHRWEVLFLTQRPETAGDTAQVQSQRWLQKHGFDMPSVFVMNGSRGKVAAALNLHAVLDDRAENCLDVATESKARSMLVWRSTPDSVPPGTRPLGIEPFFSFGAALDQLEHITIRATKPPGLLSRAQKALGIS
jgi:hypothetical protein